jgi:uncharacterized membrane protein YkoI
MHFAISAMPVVFAAALLLSDPIAAAAQNGAATAARAQFAAQMPTENGPKVDEEGTADIRAFENARVSLPDAIGAAEKHTRGKAIDAAFADYNGAPAYEVKTFQNGAVWDGMIDAITGQVIGEGETTPESDLDRDDKAELEAFQNAKQTLLQALKAAEDHSGGKAIEAGLDETDGKVVYEIGIMKNGVLETVDVNPENGQVIAAQSPPTSGRGR